MRILLNSRAFHPSVGGIEVVSRQLAGAWQSAGHEVRLWTATPLGDAGELLDLEVVRQPAPAEARALARWADVVVFSGITLRDTPYALWARTPYVYIHHAQLVRGSGKLRIVNALKRFATRWTLNVAVSRAVAGTIPGPVRVIPNAFEPALLDPRPEERRDGLLFVGRLVSEKGVDLALRAVARLRDAGRPVRLTVCGDGPERPRLERLAAELGLADAVSFEGWVRRDELAGRLRRAEAVLVPSRYEPFGIVALEAIAGGAPPVAARVGGLPEAVGPCGVLVEPEDPAALAAGVERALEPEERRRLMDGAQRHLDRFRIDAIAARYLEVLEEVVQG